ncbi:type I inositol polyphosphate 5-phosphatase 2 isoform X1 [Sesamum indicum]|uniref:Type I inositol polyphosphate 5-phosphatase 2 isoform X1 n=2 Tax=Sesamum indicum TaxID=4182 RepID=A0A6I9SKJ7_SESIN|nr:type I inositol polyphosphate 5-phosphatase 2 isoform X1 [Sesamum indicum]
MKARRGKRSEPFWPSIVMKKWLNIKPKVYDFSEDEVDTESEDDACSLKDERIHDDHADTIQTVCSSKTAGKPLKDYSVRHRRGKSETLRLQYINTKDVRVTVGTWNVAGRLPNDNLEIDDWLCMQEPADIYILGFQEVVPLNAGNVLGAENRRPIPKWEKIIRRTLNKSLEPDAKQKSYSAPPSPVFRTSSASDILADATDTPVLDIFGEDSIGTIVGGDPEITSMRKNIRLKKIYNIDWDNRLDWPEQSLDATSQPLSSRSTLRRVLSSSARIGSTWMSNGLTSSPQNIPLSGSGLKRMHRSSGNLGLIHMDQEDELEVLDSLSDELDQISGEEEDSFVEMTEIRRENALSSEAVKSHPTYVRIVSKQMVGIYVSVWVRRRLRRHINNLKVSPVGVGLMGYMGNKGSVSVSMSLFQSRLCFVCSHLTSGEKYGAEQKRNSDVHEIIRRTHFSSVFDIDQPQTIPSHDQIFWFGDLNYRINMLDSEVRKLVDKKQWAELLYNDQLSKELRNGHVFDGWKEGIINFAPTYKYEINSDRYVGENPREGEKRRSPAWCDRILWFGKGIKQLFYKRAEIRLSDHRPVSSMFNVEVEIFNQRKLQKALNFSSAVVHPEVFLDQVDDYQL